MLRSIENNKKNRPPDIGGQAVLDGVMMKSPDAIAIAVRKENGDIVVKRIPTSPPAKASLDGQAHHPGRRQHGRDDENGGQGAAGQRRHVRRPGRGGALSL